MNPVRNNHGVTINLKQKIMIKKRKISNGVKIKTFPYINLRLFWLFAILLVALFLGLYIYQVNAEISEKYSIKEYKEKISEISKENKILEINSAQVSSLANITNSLAGLNFEKTDKIHYIKIIDAQVVAK